MQRNLKGQRSLQRHQMCAVIESRREGPFVRHQISPVPKAGPGSGIISGCTRGRNPSPALDRVSVYTSRGPWIPPTREERGSETGLTSRLCLSALQKSECRLFCCGAFSPERTHVQSTPMV
ncbi:hypothetical protein NQZ68_005068 [Dissostichus eleginoides]|nr:hypothetical protein NQZ68_005068 [Dissostichus eleginoides]